MGMRRGEASDEPGAEVPEGYVHGPDESDHPGSGGPDWWHRDHSVFVPLMAFYSGLLGLTVLPALYVGVLRSTMEFEQAERWFWVIGLLVVVPLVMLASRRTRRAGAFVLLGMVTAVVVVGGVAALVLWVLMR